MVVAKLRLKESLGTNLLISFLIRYPELSSLRYNPQQATLSFTMLIKDEVAPERQTEFVTFVANYFSACRELDPRFAPLGRVTHAAEDGVTVLVYEQKMDILSIPETRLFMQLVRDFYPELGTEESVPLQEEEVYAQEEIIEQILGQKENLREEKLIVAYRDGGRVFVYNK